MPLETSTAKMTEPSDQPRAGSAPPALIAHEASTARSSVAVSASFLIANIFGGLLALLIAVIIGEGPETDGFLAAYSAYLTFILFGSTLRVALVPLLGSTSDESGFRRYASITVGQLIAAGAAVSAMLAVLSPALGYALVPGAGGNAQVTAAVSVAILAAAAWGQIWAAALSAVLVASRRFVTSAALYAAASIATAGFAALMMVAFGITGAATGVLSGALVLLTGHILYMRRFRFGALPMWTRVVRAETWKLVARATSAAAVPAALQVNLSVALAAISDRAGAVTGYAYAYFIAVTISGVTSATLGLTTMPQLVQALRERGSAVAREYLDSVAPFSVLLYLPLAAGYACFARPFLDAILQGPLTPATVDLLWDTSRVFLIMALCWAVFLPAMTLVLSLKMFGKLALMSASIVPVNAALVLAVRDHGQLAVADAQALTGALLVVMIFVLVFRARSAIVALGVLRRCLPAGALALVFPALALAGFSGGVGASAAGLLVGAALYAVLAIRLWPSVAGRAVRLLLSRG
jgi:peptidoglycan biosynthesis protein MviN/MurJ (putative lipid II flippase)